MNKYVGRYRALCERDLDGEPLDNAFTYLKCVAKNKGAKVYRYNDNTLVFYTPSKQKGNNILKELYEMKVTVVKTEEYEKEMDIHFRESDLELLSEIFCLTSSGAKIPPTSVKNHPRYKEIKQERFDALSDEEKEERILKGKKLREILDSKEK